jgi:hypothetical protein
MHILSWTDNILHKTHLLSNFPLKHALFCDRSTAEFTVTYRTINKMPYFLVTLQTYNASPYLSPDDFSGITRWTGDTVYLRIKGVNASFRFNLGSRTEALFTGISNESFYYSMCRACKKYNHLFLLQSKLPEPHFPISC